LSKLLTEIKGWRFTYELVGLIGIGSGVLGILILKEPSRGNFDPNR